MSRRRLTRALADSLLAHRSAGWAGRLGTYLLAVLFIGTAFAVRMLLANQAGNGAVAIIFVPSILLSACVGGLGPGLFATVMAAAGSAYFLLPSLAFFSAQGAVHRVMWTLLCVSGIAISVLVQALHRSRWRLEDNDATLRESEERFRVMADNSPIILWVTDAQGGIQFVNRTYREYFGVTSAEVKGARWIIHPEDASKYLGDFLRAVREPSPFKGEARFRRKDGEWRSVSTHGEPRYSATGEFLGHVGTTLDITYQRLIEEQSQQSQRLESIGRLAGGIAHDFNNVLTVILSCAEALKENVGAGTPAQLELIEEIDAAGRRAAELPRQLLAFARSQVIAPVSLDLNTVLQRSEKMLRRVLGEDVELVTTLQPALWAVRCDPGQIEQVILNLAINARDAMPGGGRLGIQTTNVEIDESLVAAQPFLRAGPHVRVRFTDSGTGMTPEVRDHLFEPFFTTKPQGKGTGLGLSMVYGIVKQSEGSILLESEAGRGTTFDLYFPRTAAEAVQAPAVSAMTGRGAENPFAAAELRERMRKIVDSR